MKKNFLKLFSLMVIAAVVLSLAACGDESKAADNTTSVSRYESPEGYTAVKNILSWEKINAIPVKTEGMSTEEIRQMIVDVHLLSRDFV